MAVQSTSAPDVAGGESQRAMTNGIDGVILKPLAVHCDDRGTFMELLREDDSFFSRFGQSNFSITYPGVIKAFHWHREQDDLWFIAAGMAQVVLYDLRADSRTHQQTQVLYLGDHARHLLVIPAGVAHGYRVLGNEPLLMIYHTTQTYNPRDELRIPYDDPGIGFDWTTRMR